MLANEPNSKNYMLYDSICNIFENRQNQSMMEKTIITLFTPVEGEGIDEKQPHVNFLRRWKCSVFAVYAFVKTH